MNTILLSSQDCYLELQNVRNRNFNKIIKQVIDIKTNEPTKLTIHGLRHTFASRSLMKGVPLVEVSGYLGHKDSVITAQIYTHYLPTQAENTASVMEEIINS